MPSLAIATTKSRAAHHRSAPSEPSSASSIHMNTGASTILATVIAFGRFQFEMRAQQPTRSMPSCLLPTGETPGVFVRTALDLRIVLELGLDRVRAVGVGLDAAGSADDRSGRSCCRRRRRGGRSG